MPAQPDNSPVIDEKKVESVSDSVEENRRFTVLELN